MHPKEHISHRAQAHAPPVILRDLNEKVAQNTAAATKPDILQDASYQIWVFSVRSLIKEGAGPSEQELGLACRRPGEGHHHPAEQNDPNSDARSDPPHGDNQTAEHHHLEPHEDREIDKPVVAEEAFFLLVDGKCPS